MRDAIVKFRLTENEKDRLFGFSERIGMTASDVIRSAIHQLYSHKPIDRSTQSDLCNLRRVLNLVIDKPTASAVAEAKKVATRILGRVRS